MPTADDHYRLTLCLIACVVAMMMYGLGKYDAREDMRRTEHAQE